MTRTTIRMAALGLGAALSACPGTLDETSFYGNAPGASEAPEVGASSEQPVQPEQGARQPWVREAMAALDAGSLDAGASDAGARDAEREGATDASQVISASDAVVASGPAEAAVIVDAAPAGRDARVATPEAGAACDVPALFAQKCGNAGCHGAGAVASGLDLTSNDLATRLAGKKGSGACGSHLLIDREAPERSALYVKVTAEACGSRMPLGGTLSEREQACILSWLENM
jgi:hypothetical protein